MRAKKYGIEADAVALSSGQIMLMPQSYTHSLTCIRSVLHEEFEMLLQIVRAQDPARYGGIKESFLSRPAILASMRRLTPQLPTEVTEADVNHMIATAFELIFLDEYGLGSRSVAEQVFLKVARPAVEQNRHSYFTAEFWNRDLRMAAIAGAIRNGIIFDTAFAKRTKGKKTGPIRYSRQKLLNSERHIIATTTDAAVLIRYLHGRNEVLQRTALARVSELEIADAAPSIRLLLAQEKGSNKKDTSLMLLCAQGLPG